MNEIKIQIYKVDDFDHHVPESIDESFKAEVKNAGKQYQSIRDYLVSSEEHEVSCDEPVIENEIFHSINGVNAEAIQDVDVLIYEVGDNFMIHCPLEQMDALANQIAFHNQQSKEGDEYSITIREYKANCKNPSSNECFISIDADFKNHDPLASLFSKELNKRNIKKIEDITMTTSTKNKPQDNQAQDKVQVVFDGANLSLYLKKCSREFLDELILTFGDDGVKALDYSHTTKAKRASAYDLMIVEENEEKFLIVKEFYDLVVGNASQMKEALADFQKAREEYQEVKDSYQSKLDARVNKLGSQFEIKKEHRKQHNEILGKLQRAKQIKKGLKGYGTAVALAHVDGIQDQVIASASYIAAKTSELAKREKLDDKTLEGTERLVDKLSGKIDNLIANVQREDGQPNALANRLVSETKTQMDNLNAKVKEAEKEKQPAKS
ncbi:MAG: hypothetical protein WBM86_21700 [Waterburya sp.]